METVYFHFIMSVLAVWRLTHLLSKEDGPFNLIFKLRKQIGQGFFGALLDCFYCLSIWIAIPFGIWVANDIMEKIICCLALSGGACIIEKLINKTNKPPQYFED
jgi:Protein of unknown function (DUF1360)